MVEFRNLLAMLVDGVLYQVVAMRTVQASLVTVVFVLLAAIARSSFDIVVTRALAVFVALRALRSTNVTVTRLASFGRESVLVGLALVAPQASHSGLAEALTGVGVARRVVRTDRITFAALATFAASDVPESNLALVTILSDNVLFAVTIARHLVTHRDSIWGFDGSARVARTGIARSMRRSIRISKVAGQALVAMWSGSIVDALQALAVRAVAVSDGIWVSISVTIAKLAELNLSSDAGRVTEVAVRADLTTWA